MNDAVKREGNASRREFLRKAVFGAGAVALASRAGNLSAEPAQQAETAPNWTARIGLELYTVRDMIAKDYQGTLEKVAQIGYKEVEPAEGYNNMPPKAFRALLDRLGMRVPSTHSGIIEGADAVVEKQLDGFKIMGIQYASLDAARPQRSRVRRPFTPAERARMNARMSSSRTVDDVKREAALYNQYGKLAQKFGIKILRHNHTMEFQRCQGSELTPYDILLSETDPEVVAMQMDIGWAEVAGQNPIELFHKHPGRFVLWHVKDVACLKCLPSVTDEFARLRAARLVPVGEGDIDYENIFKYADLAGMKHFVVEQDSAADWGDSIAAAKVSFEHLRAMLSGLPNRTS
ncbi:MAG TPA: sugar phosphate isomerase/epimerase [Terriglobia bacterium]|nr:sugar phosphate isomerase/epimerase [Terriglobia bacterium]